MHQYPDFLLKASSGLIPGVTSLFKFGHNTDIDTGTAPEDITSLGGSKLFPTAASTISTVSTDAADSAAGTGIRTIRIQGLDSDYVEVHEDITLNGLTPVVTTQTFIRVYRLYGLTAGSNQRAVGSIVATHSEGDISEIQPSTGQSQDATYTVPLNHTLYVDRFTSSLERTASGSGAEVHFETMVFGSNVWREHASISIMASGTSYAIRDTEIWFPILEKTDIRIHVSQVATNNTDIAAAFEGFLIDNTVFKW